MKRLVVTLLCLLAGAACAEVEVLQPGPGDCCDSWVLEDAPDQNWGSWTALMFGCTSEWDTWLALLRFDELDDPRFDDIILQDAALWLMPQEGGGSGSPPLDCFVRKITGDWDQDTVTWNNKPQYDMYPTIDFTYTTDEDWIIVDVFEIVDDWIIEGHTQHSFCVGPEENHYCSVLCCSGEYDEPGYYYYRPALRLTYSPAAVSETSWGEIKALE
ncbi:MAG: DNRLRE domain-containing protein [Candidatus Coatesbacteria bacterium]|nr:DNRLRE domain-containing protein [Candidatus Coatesbacteria bacterium]